MNLIVGYQLRPDERLIRCILDHRDAIGEVYFAWPGVANGRTTIGRRIDLAPWEAVNRQRAELKTLANAGLKLNLLLNANCYGAASLARGFYSEIGDLIDLLDGEMGLDSITTASPVIARFVKQNFPALEVRASVNMEIGTREGVEYLADVMDGFYVKREMNRSIDRVRAFSEIIRSMGKKIYLLANSGCLNYCSARSFHDNLVSHESEMMRMDNAYDFHGVCRDFLANGDHRRRILQISNWIRPQDLRHYEGLVDGVKLATRVSENPEMIVHAYATGRFTGNMLSLTEPDFSALYRPSVLAADRFPTDYFEKTSICDRNCAQCGYCLRAFDAAEEKLTDNVLF